MRYFIDTEFIEGFHKPLFGKRRHCIDLISIGIVAEDGREYYAISNEFNPKDANQWVKENVLDSLQKEMYQSESTYAKTYHSGSLTLKNLLKWRGKSNQQIAKEITEFVYNNGYLFAENNEKVASEYIGTEFTKSTIEFYGYYADYDWVLFCSLFGRMIDLPKGFPMYCRDLKQMLDDRAAKETEGWVLPPTLEHQLKSLKGRPDYPKQQNEHNALADAKWNFELYKFLQSL